MWVMEGQSVEEVRRRAAIVLDDVAEAMEAAGLEITQSCGRPQWISCG